MELIIEDEETFVTFAQRFSCLIKPGDLVTLEGEVGTGKSIFARALIRALANDDFMEVPSPSFTLIQYYNLACFPVAHADFYRLRNPHELAELGLEELQREGVLLIEWAQHAQGMLAPASFAIRLSEYGDGRYVKVEAGLRARDRIERLWPFYKG